jgi:hypothetical protein
VVDCANTATHLIVSRPTEEERVDIAVFVTLPTNKGGKKEDAKTATSSTSSKPAAYKSAQGSRIVSIEAGPLGQAIVGSTDTLAVRLARDLVKDARLSLDDWLTAKGQSSVHKSAA